MSGVSNREGGFQSVLESLVLRDASLCDAPQDESVVRGERWIAASGYALLAMTCWKNKKAGPEARFFNGVATETITPRTQ